jgi:peptidoglycan/LPS O-acetylase OafA/YrhL
MQAHQRSLRLTELDALRGLAALSVLFYHFTGQFDRLYGHPPPPPYAFEAGNYGVQLFFVISGFVIFMTLERTKHALDFAVSRFSRLFPAFWAALAITLLAVQFAGLPGQRVPVYDALINVTMLPDFFGAREVDGSYWTLQIELFFYVQMLLWFMVGGLKRIRLVIVGWLLLVAVYGIEARLGVSLSYTVRELLVVRFIAFFAAGISLFRAYRGDDRPWQSALLLAGCVLGTWAVWSWQEALVLALCIGIFALFIRGQLRVLSRQPFVALGAVSYTLYLLHQDIGYISIAYLERSGFAPWASIALSAVAMLALACLLTITVERPAMRAIRGAYARWRERSDRKIAAGSP